MGRDTATSWPWSMIQAISIHSPRMGRDCPCHGCSGSGRINFNPLSPHGERLIQFIKSTDIYAYFNPLSPHGERRLFRFLRGYRVPISIHSPRMGRDTTASGPKSMTGYFNPLSPHGERRSAARLPSSCRRFQSTLPAWGETGSAVVRPMVKHNFNPLSPHGERPEGDQIKAYVGLISIHSPRMGRDGVAWSSDRVRSISIHSPRMGRDSRRVRFSNPASHFNPLSPHGERPKDMKTWAGILGDFNPLSPHGERHEPQRAAILTAISIHSPRMGRDDDGQGRGHADGHFNPLSPHGERRGRGSRVLRNPFLYFNPLSPHGERQQSCRSGSATSVISIHSPRMGRDVHLLSQRIQTGHFNPLSPHGERPPPCGRCGRSLPHFNPLSPHGERHKFSQEPQKDLMISIHSPRMGRDPCWRGRGRVHRISIHSPRMGRDRRWRCWESAERRFQSTLPAWGETTKSMFTFPP